MTNKEARVAIMLEFHSIVHSNANELARLIVLENENGKIITEALADVAKGNETVDTPARCRNCCRCRGRSTREQRRGHMS